MRAAGVAQACGMLCVAWHGANVPRCMQLQRLASALSFGAGPVGIRRQLAGAVCAAVCEAAPRVKIWALDVLGTRGRVFRGVCVCQRWSAAVMCALCSVRLQVGSKVHCVACCVHSRRVKHDKCVSSFVSVCFRSVFSLSVHSHYLFSLSVHSHRCEYGVHTSP